MVIIAFALFSKLNSLEKENTRISKPNYLCDTTISDCATKIPSSIPKGVCIPGGKCTSG